MKKLYVTTPQIEIYSEFYKDEILEILQIRIAHEIASNPKWFNKYKQLAEEIFNETMEKIKSEKETVKHIDLLDPHKVKGGVKHYPNKQYI